MSPPNSLTPKTILFADDESNDRAMLRMAITAANSRTNYQFVHDGVEVMDYFQGKGIFKDRTTFPLPRVLVLDLTMPRMGGLEVIAGLQRTNSLEGVHVCILTANEDPEIRANVAKAKARLIAKPSLASQWRDLITGLDQL